MTCNGCGNGNAYQVRAYVDREGMQEICNECSKLSPGEAASPDVHLSRIGQRFQNLCDEMGRPYEIRSKRHKKEVMDRLGVSEAGDRVDGARFGSKTWIEGTRAWRRKQFDKERPRIREIYRQWRENARSK